ncbi:Transposon Ty3-I Gag-Pol polyprotein [Thelohanellus kitauei]|uniref:Transposon Ty3-I Gag-Pol polyprotein n=1 Tax=Thelohanellus kitauei TaxID=669202 RepID=A0A0C2MJS5_THEKT|nr:Transposon Ty3-I Gag-Pol polyprotein [Thelohanellus kitauei]
MLSHGIIRKSASNFHSTITFANKKDGGKRLCVDFRQVNEHILREQYQLPLIEELVDRMDGSLYYSENRLSSAYWQVPIIGNDKYKKVFSVGPGWGIYEFNVILFGINKAGPPFKG